MQMLAVAMYVGHPEVVTVKVIDRARLGFQRGFWSSAQKTKSITPKNAEESAEHAERESLHFYSLFSEQDNQPARR